MNRRSALLLTMLFGGLAPRALRAQDAPRRSGFSAAGRTRRVAGDFEASAADSGARRTREAALDPLDADDPAPGPDDQLPADFPAEAGRQLRDFDISPYTRLVTNNSSPQTALLDWIFRRTGSRPWHDDKVSVLSASKARLRVYHTESVIKQVYDVVDRFVNAPADILELTVRIVAAADTRWRYTHLTHLKTVGSGAQGQRVWTLSAERALMLRTELQTYQGYKALATRTLEMVNGQNLKWESFVPVPYTGSLARDSVAGLGYQPKTEQLQEGVELNLSPLLTYDGDAVDLALQLTASTVRSLHRTRVIAPRDIGANEATVDVPEVASTRLDTTVKNWPIDQTLLISAGILPGILLSNKRGLFNLRLPGTVPTETELLVFIDVKALDSGRGSTEP